MNRQRIRYSMIFILFLLFPAIFYYMSPYIIIDGTIHGVITGSFILFSLQFITALILGRLFCGWICPAGGVQEAVFRINEKRIKKGNIIKWILWVPWIATIVLLAIRNKGYSTIEIAYNTMYGISISDIYSFITYLCVLFLIVLPGLLVGKRSFCHHVCWMAPFMILGETIGRKLKFPQLQLKADKGKCIQCHLCTKNCPMSLEVEEMIEKKRVYDKECIKCLNCIDICPKNVIKLEFNNKR